MIKVLILNLKKKTQNRYITLLEEALIAEKIDLMFPEKIHRFFPMTRNVVSSKCDVLHIQWVFNLAGFNSKNIIKYFFKFFFFLADVLIVKYFLRKKIIWTIHNLYSHEARLPSIERLGRRTLAKIADGNICLCNFAKELIANEYLIPMNKLHVIPLGNYLLSYKNQILKEEARNFLNIKKNDFVFLFFGIIRPYKGVENLINCFKDLKLDTTTKLLIAGNPIDNELKRKILKSIKNCHNISAYLKFFPDDEVQIYLNASDVVVIPYQEVLSSSSALLAMTFKKPIVAPRRGCLIEILNEKGSFLYDIKDQEGLSHALSNANSKRSKLETMGEYNLSLAESFKWKYIAEKTKVLYLRALKK